MVHLWFFLKQVVTLQADETVLVGGCQSDMVLALTMTQLLNLNQSHNDACPLHYTKDMLKMLLLLPRWNLEPLIALVFVKAWQ